MTFFSVSIPNEPSLIAIIRNGFATVSWPDLELYFVFLLQVLIQREMPFPGAFLATQPFADDLKEFLFLIRSDVVEPPDHVTVKQANQNGEIEKSGIICL